MPNRHICQEPEFARPGQSLLTGYFLGMSLRASRQAPVFSSVCLVVPAPPSAAPTHQQRRARASNRPLLGKQGSPAEADDKGGASIGFTAAAPVIVDYAYRMQHVDGSGRGWWGDQGDATKVGLRRTEPDSGGASGAVSFSCAKSILNYNTVVIPRW